MAIDWKALEREAERIIKAAAPELDALPLQMLDVAKLTGDSAPSRIAVAWAGMIDDHLLARPHVADYRGPGPVIFYSAAAIEGEARANRVPVADAFIEIMIHEAGHILDGRDLAAYAAPREVDPVFLALCHREIVRLSREENTSESDARYEDVHLKHHGPRWIRACCHLKHRVEHRLNKLYPVVEIIRNDYGPRGEFFLHALDDELDRCADMPIADILKLPLPTEFELLWEQNVAGYRKREEEYEKQNQRRQAAEAAGGTVPLPAVAGADANQQEGINMNSIATKFAEAIGIRRKRKQTAREAFESTGRDMADGKDVAPAVIEQVCFEVKEEPETLQAFVQRILDRKQERRDVDAGESVPAEREKAAAEYESVRVKWERMNEEHNSALWKLANIERELNQREQKANNARSALERGAPVELHNALRDLGQQVGAIAEQRRQLDRRREHYRGQVADLMRAEQHARDEIRTMGARIETKAVVADTPAKITSLETELANIGNELTELDAKEAGLQRQIEAVRSKMLEP